MEDCQHARNGGAMIRMDKRQRAKAEETKQQEIPGTEGGGQ